MIRNNLLFGQRYFQSAHCHNFEVSVTIREKINGRGLKFRTSILDGDGKNIYPYPYLSLSGIFFRTLLREKMSRM